MHIIQILKLCIATSLAATLVIGVLFMARVADDEDMRSHVKQVAVEHKLRKDDEHRQDKPAAEPLDIPLTKMHPFTIRQEEVENLKKSPQQPSVHIFYYPWFGNPEFDGKYYHWDHPLLKSSPQSEMPPRNHTPPEDIASVFYPLLGPYSSRDPKVIDQHMKWIMSSGVDVIAVSFYPSGKADEQGYPWDSLLPVLLEACEKYQLKMTFHLEPYEGRTALSVRDDIEYIIRTFGKFPAFYRTTSKKDASKQLPLFYIYDSYKVPDRQWTEIATLNGTSTIRNTEIDALLIGLPLRISDVSSIASNGFDGIYTYFAADGFTQASTMSNWPNISQLCSNHSLLFIPSIGPGYDDTRVRPWNSQTTRSRENGSYYRQYFEMAHASRADIVSITSFNEFHEGTNIEPAVPFHGENATEFVYATYNKSPEYYLHLTHEMIQKYFVAHHENIPMNIAKIV